MEKNYFMLFSHETTHEQWATLESRWLSAEQFSVVREATRLALSQTVLINPNQLELEVGDGI